MFVGIAIGVMTSTRTLLSRFQKEVCMELYDTPNFRAVVSVKVEYSNVVFLYWYVIVCTVNADALLEYQCVLASSVSCIVVLVLVCRLSRVRDFRTKLYLKLIL
jgi:hypothetical protein